MSDPLIYGHAYKFGRLNAMQQFHVMRRLYAVSAALGEGFDTLRKQGGAETLLQKEKETNILEIITPLIRAIGQMSDQDAEYIISTCLGVVERQGAGGWSRVQVAPGQLMFQDIDMPCMMALTWRVLETNLSGFFFDLLSGFPAAMGVEMGSSLSPEKTTG